MKRLISIILSVLMLCSVFTSTALTASAVETSVKAISAVSGDFSYELINDGEEAEIIGYTGSASELTIPAELGGVPVTGMRAKIFINNKTVKKVTIPKTMKSMRSNNGGYHGALYGSVIETVVFEDGITEIPAMACHGASKLTSVTIPDSVTTIRSEAFNGTALKSLTLPSTLENIEAKILQNNTGVKEIVIPKTVTSAKSNNGGYHGAFYDSAIENVVFEDGIKVIPDMTLHGAKKLTSVTIPNSVEAINAEVFYDCVALTEISIPNSVKSIGAGAFARSGLTALNLPAKLESLGAKVLADNTGVKEVTIPKTVKTMRSNYGGYHGAFYDSAIENVVFEDGIKVIPDMTLHGAKKLTSVTIPNSVEAINAEVFYDCVALTEISIPNSVKSIGAGAFARSGLTALNLPAKLESLGAKVLADNTGVKEVTIPKTVKTMRSNYGGYHGSFYDSAIESATFEEGATTVPVQAFQGATKLTSVVIPETVTSIGTEAFMNTALTSLTLSSKLTTIEAKILYGNTTVKEITIPKTVTIMRSNNGGYHGAFYNSAIETVVFEEGIKAIPEQALQGAKNLVSVTVPMRVKAIGNEAFDETNADFTINGYDGSVAHNYAKSNNLNYVSLGVEPLDTTITLAKASATVYLTGTTKIKATVKNGVGKTLYRSTNTKVATVNAKGVVTAKQAGIAKITVTNNDVTKTFTVTVKKPTLNKTKQTLKKGKTFTLKVKGQVGKAKFTTSNKKVATVNTKGKIVAKKNGNATITVKTNGITLKCKVTVK